MRCRLLAASLALCACQSTIGPFSGETDAGSQECVQAVPLPEVPVLLSAPSGLVEVTDSLSLSASSPESSAVTEVQFEIWILAGSELVQRVWSAQVGTEAEVALADGTFEPGFEALWPWTRYAVRARFGNGNPCEAGAWSELSSFRSDDGSSLFFSDVVHTFDLRIGAGSWDAIDDEAVAPWCEPYQRSYYEGGFDFGEHVFDHVGVRVKGASGSSRPLSGKPGFKVHLAWDDPAVAGCPDERRLFGLQRFTLNNMVQDRSFVRQSIGYEFFGMLGVPVPRVAFAELRVNDEHWGLYLNVESFDRRFFARRFESARGMLYEGNCGCDFEPDAIPADGEVEYCWERKFGADECSDIEEGDDPRSFSPLLELSNQIAALPAGEFYPAIEALVDFEAYLSMWAAETILNHWDGYTFHIQNNFRVYHDPSTDKWTVLPSGIDQILSYVTDLGSPLQVSAFAPVGLLAQRCLEESDCEAAFAARLHEAVNLFEAQDFAARARALETAIESHVMADPRRPSSVADFHAQVDNVVSFINARPAQVRSMLSARGY